LKSRPVTIRMPTVVKYCELTNVNFEECRFKSFDAGSTNPIVQLLLSSGTLVVVAAETTCGTDRMRSSNSLCAAKTRSSAGRSLKSATRAKMTPSRLKPVSNVIRFLKLRTNSAAPTMRTNDHGDLCDDETALKPRSFSASHQPASPGLHRRSGLHMRGSKRRHDTEGDAGEHARGGRESEHEPVRPQIEVERIAFGREERQDSAAEGTRGGGAEDRSAHGE